MLFSLPAAHAEFRFPMPEFSGGYEHPPVHVPAPSNAMAGWDVAVLIGCLSLASFLVLKRRRRREIFWLTLFSVIYFGFWRKGCVCSVGSIQNILAGIFDSSYGVPFTVLVFFAAPLVFALFFGRVFCSSVCPLGAVQELVAIRPVKVPPAVEKVLSVFPFIYLGLTVVSVALGSGFIICRYDPFVGFFRMGAGFNMLVFGGILLLVGIFVARPYCRFLCPYGVLLNGCSRLSRRHAVITPSDCIRCDLCADSCPYNAIREPEPPEPAKDRMQGTRRLGRLLLLLPLLIGIGVGIGSLLKEPLSRMHPTVRLAERMAGEELGRFEHPTIDSETFRASDRPADDLYAEALQIKQGYGAGGRWLGGFVGLVIAFKLIAVSVYRSRTGYEPDRGTCFSCGRCFKYCPVGLPEKGDDV
ncbi:MAG: 4Fe-4S binding protein [Pontiellaceae bacterium]|nr:4Fe-4S binding protein [Pontiellaceae bacterium]MBN2785600.1 4Fe-4S binding protein [Pontiellaceae bacterium]